MYLHAEVGAKDGKFEVFGVNGDFELCAFFRAWLLLTTAFNTHRAQPYVFNVVSLDKSWVPCCMSHLQQANWRSLQSECKWYQPARHRIYLGTQGMVKKRRLYDLSPTLLIVSIW